MPPPVSRQKGEDGETSEGSPLASLDQSQTPPPILGGQSGHPLDGYNRPARTLDLKFGREVLTRVATSRFGKQQLADEGHGLSGGFSFLI